MSAAVTFIILTPFVFSQRKNLVPVLLCCILLLRVLTGKNGDGVYTGDNSVFAFLTPFLLGCLCDETGLLNRWAAIGRGVWWKKAIKIMLELTLLVFLYKLYFEIPIKRFWEFYFGFVPFVLIVFCTEFILPIPGVKLVLRFFGKYSYGISLIHTFIRAYYLGNITYSMRHFCLSFCSCSALRWSFQS